MQAPSIYLRRFGKYYLLDTLSVGAAGTVQLAVTSAHGLERLLVIKTVLPQLADPEFVARFRNESKVLVRLSHRNVISVLDAGMIGGEVFVAMELVEGRDLRAVWNRCAKKKVAFPIDVVVTIVKEICCALAHAHSLPASGLVHRDVSPPNVLLSCSGEVKVMDFGLAPTLKLESTAPSLIHRRVPYMSPEQACHEKLDGRSDMYSAAVVLWELLTGRQLHPPHKDLASDFVARAGDPRVMAPSKRAPRVPVELDAICLRALAIEPRDRYSDCAEMAAVLQTWLARNAPETDARRMAAFLHDLFAADIMRERTNRAELISRVRERALTLSANDEFRRLVEHGGDSGPAGATSDSAAAQDRARSQDLGPGLLGAVIDGRYRVIQLIGAGGAGKLYLAERVATGKPVALKVLDPSCAQMPDLVERFRREAASVLKIGPPGIVDITDSGATSDGIIYFVVE